MTFGLVAVAGATLVGGVVAAKGAKSAAKTQAGSADAAVTEQQRQFDLTQESFRPAIEAGDQAREQQRLLLGLGGVESQQQAFDTMAQSPGQQFLRQRAQKNLLRNSAAIGGLGGGNVREALVQQGVGFAQQDLQNRFGRLGQVAGQGQSAATNVGQFGAQAAGNIGNALMASGDARASGITGQSNAIQNTIGGLANVGGQLFGQQPQQQYGGNVGPITANPINTPWGGR